MDDVRGVRGAHGLKQLRDDLATELDVERRASLYHSVEVRSLEQLHRQIGEVRLLVAPRVEDADDVVALDALADLRLLKEPLEKVRRVRELPAHDLEGPLRASLQVDCAVDRAHGPLPEEPLDAVAPRKGLACQ